MSLPIFQSDNKDMSLMQTSWAGQLNPMLNNPLLNGSILSNVALVSGANAVNHKLGRKLQGWLVVRKRANQDIHDAQDTNQTPALTLALVAGGAVTVDLYVF